MLELSHLQPLDLFKLTSFKNLKLSSSQPFKLWNLQTFKPSTLQTVKLSSLEASKLSKAFRASQVPLSKLWRSAIWKCWVWNVVSLEVWNPEAFHNFQSLNVWRFESLSVWRRVCPTSYYTSSKPVARWPPRVATYVATSSYIAFSRHVLPGSSHASILGPSHPGICSYPCFMMGWGGLGAWSPGWPCSTLWSLHHALEMCTPFFYDGLGDGLGVCSPWCGHASTLGSPRH